MPKIPESAYVAPGAVIVGDVTLGENVSVWYNAVLRGDAGSITIGDNSNVQDLVTIHVNEKYPVKIGRNVSIGHNAVIHSATIGDNVLVGMGAVLMDDCKIGANSVIGAGSLVTAGKEYPPNSLIMGSPAKVKRELTQEDVEAMVLFNADFYRAGAKMNKEGLWDQNLLDILEEFRGSWKEALKDEE